MACFEDGVPVVGEGFALDVEETGKGLCEEKDADRDAEGRACVKLVLERGLMFGREEDDGCISSKSCNCVRNCSGCVEADDECRLRSWSSC